MFCVKCETQLSDGSKFCSNCGVDLASINSSVDAQFKNQEEQILMNVGASLFRGIEAVGGRLKVTPKRLVFSSHLFNIQVGSTEIQINNIASIEKAKSLGFINNRMIVILKSGVRYKFLLNNRDDVISTIERELKNIMA
jgi:hypothetical protein